jgi:hypothetical protein
MDIATAKQKLTAAKADGYGSMIDEAEWYLSNLTRDEILAFILQCALNTSRESSLRPLLEAQAIISLAEGRYR